MDPQTISLLAGRVALEWLDTVDHEQHAPAHRRAGSIARLTGLIVAPVTHFIAARRSPARAASPRPLGSGSEG